MSVCLSVCVAGMDQVPGSGVTSWLPVHRRRFFEDNSNPDPSSWTMGDPGKPTMLHRTSLDSVPLCPQHQPGDVVHQARWHQREPIAGRRARFNGYPGPHPSAGAMLSQTPRGQF
eukprot:TRINITY_DN3895_c0_g1_i1.p1 TRINITY_DN3895_c0_g1~~TRINITY_DN3895_c0_g1_i1.p1  ORF type:complete len:115 (+),score=3.50 TRINITY_DN3895_c0_g1_i1:43-387(+)